MPSLAWLTNPLAWFRFPELCPACRGPTRAGFCAGCVAEFRRVVAPCSACGLPAPVEHCPRLWETWHVDSVLAPFEYAYPLDHYLHALKYAGGRKLGRALGLLVADRLAADASSAVLVPVPLHRARLRQRGYNQAVEIARALADELGLALDAAAACRPEQAATQSRLAADERRANVRNAFRVTRSMTDRRVVVVDDVITTGATVNALAEALRHAGAARVDALAVARTFAPTARAAESAPGEPYSAAQGAPGKTVAASAAPTAPRNT